MAWVKVSATLGLPAPLNPIWLSLIWTNRNVGRDCVETLGVDPAI